MVPMGSSINFVEKTYYLNLFATMEQLVHLQIDEIFGKESWEKLAAQQVLPNLKILKTIFDIRSLAVICENWRKLERLSLMFGNDVNEEVLTGIGKGLNLELEGGHLNERKRFPNLTDLKELTDFELMTYCGLSKITNVTVNHGFLKMPVLENLIICVSSEMTSEAEELLTTKIKCVKVYKNDKIWQHESINAEIKCCVNKLYRFGPSNCKLFIN